MKKFNFEKGDGPPLAEIRTALDERETGFMANAATPSRLGVRRRPEKQLASDYRQAFSLDVDRILHSLAYTRYIDKTQVFYLIRNDHITHRVLHVQLVSKIARTIGRFLLLNEDLIEAIALGHDIGHTPFGHDGEKFLSHLCRAHGIGSFHHNVQSVQFLDRVEKKGTGWNLCLQTLDGILCHDGEVHDRRLTPDPGKTFETLKRDIYEKTFNENTVLIPMTLEGCVVRMADTIAYIGRDLEDAIRLNLLKRNDIPKAVGDTLGNTNGTIVYTLVTDVIRNSYQTPYVAFSENVSNALRRLKAFNLERIYMNPVIKKYLKQIETLFEMRFHQYLADIEADNRESVIFTSFLADMSHDYIQEHPKEAIVRDFIAGMTDRYFLSQCPAHMRPKALEI
ncbi:MAG: HD domain-containing protein [Desulfobacterales bacterium]|jgi:dGTPase|nr:HD domain-containing protein [Desulfobacterales bacterium]